MNPPSSESFRYVKAASCAAGVAILLSLAWFASDILLLGFAGVLLAVVFRSAAEFLHRFTQLSMAWSLALTLAILIAIVAGGTLLGGTSVAREIDQLRTELPKDWQSAKEKLSGTNWGQTLLQQISQATNNFPAQRTAGRILNAFSLTASAIGGAIVTFFLALYFAADPGLYRRGLLHLVPQAAERRGGEVLDRISQQLWHWLIGKLALMLFVGVATSIGLWILDMPLVISLAAIAALLDFIPNIGPIISAIPALIIAFTHGPTTALWVGVLYLVVQLVESYVLQPLVQQRAVSLPPSLTLLSQILFSSLFGSLGLLLATPLTVLMITVVQMLYVQDFLQKGSET